MSGSVHLGASALSVSEAEGQVLVPIVRTGDLSGTATVEYSVTGSTATAGLDFAAVVGSVTFAAGVDRVLVPVTILDDSLAELTETLIVSITNVEGGSLQAPRTARISILDDEAPVTDPPDPPLVSSFTVAQQVTVAGLSQPIDMELVTGLPGESAAGTFAYVAEKGGRIKLVDTLSGATLSTFVDISGRVNDFLDRGLMSIAVHPNFPATPYIYAFYVVDPAGTEGYSGNAGADGGGNRFAYVVRFTADAATGYRTAVAGSETILVGGAGQSLSDISGAGAVDSTSTLAQPESGRTAGGGYVDNYIKVDSRSHAGGSLAFGPDGMLYVSTGDGTSFDFADPRAASVQSLDSLSGKILRIDPETGLGLADNPFVDGGNSLASNRARVYQLGLRNPFSISFDSNGQLLITNTGWYSYESIDTGPAGANFGWPYYEGGDGGVLRELPDYGLLPGGAEFYAAVAAGTIDITAPFRSFSHERADPGYQVQAIVGGDVVYSGDRYPEALRGDYFFADFSQGAVYTVDVADRRQINYLYTTASGFGPVHFTQGADGYVYYVDLVAGEIGRLLISGGGTVNMLPDAADDVAATGANVRIGRLDVLANDRDPDGPAGSLRVSAVGGLAAGVGVAIAGDAGGRFVIHADGSSTFDPGSDFAGLASGGARTTRITYTASDLLGGETDATLAVTVTAAAGEGSQLTIAASGATGHETMQLVIGGKVAATFTDVPVGGTTYTYQADHHVVADDVRVAFVNDVWDPALGIDYNLVVDHISIDGHILETEDASVFSTATWRPEDDVVPGYGRGDNLATNGYFQFADPLRLGTSITIHARGATGHEQMQLLIDGLPVATYDDVPTADRTYVYASTRALSPSQVRVAFLNDTWDPANGIDYNLTVDSVDIGGITFQTEGMNVYSTAVWRPEDDIIPGYGRGETLATNGYFQFGVLAPYPG
ncbi:MAG: PQQ-dependent sugar dehydrogenase [Hyphomicrobiaceae bacterium]